MLLLEASTVEAVRERRRASPTGLWDPEVEPEWRERDDKRQLLTDAWDVP